MVVRCRCGVVTGIINNNRLKYKVAHSNPLPSVPANAGPKAPGALISEPTPYEIERYARVLATADEKTHRPALRTMDDLEELIKTSDGMNQVQKTFDLVAMPKRKCSASSSSSSASRAPFALVGVLVLW